MIFLVLAAVSSTLNHLIFKACARFKVDLLSAIVVNYVVCILIGTVASIEHLSPSSIVTQAWLPFSVVQGAVFVVCFFLMGRTTEVQGVVIASLAGRLSVAIPTLIAFFLFGDAVTLLKTFGILVALAALYLSVGSAPAATRPARTTALLPIALFIAFGTHSTLLKLAQAYFLGSTSTHTYVMAAFLSAFLLGAAALIRRQLKRPKVLRWRDLYLGLVLGCANYGAIYFLLRALAVPGWQSSQLFPTLSIAVLCLSALGAWACFRERIRLRMLGAMALGIAAIILVYL
jgi:drug/metabolite transporter (DMT)-like permease